MTKAEKSVPDARRSEGEYLGVRYMHVTSPDRAVHVFSAYPAPDLHVRSNSRSGPPAGDRSHSGFGRDGPAGDSPGRHGRVCLHPHVAAARGGGGGRLDLPVGSVHPPARRAAAQADGTPPDAVLQPSADDRACGVAVSHANGQGGRNASGSGAGQLFAGRVWHREVGLSRRRQLRVVAGRPHGRVLAPRPRGVPDALLRDTADRGHELRSCRSTAFSSNSTTSIGGRSSIRSRSASRLRRNVTGSRRSCCR